MAKVGYPQPVATVGGEERLLEKCTHANWDIARDWNANSINYLIEHKDLEVNNAVALQLAIPIMTTLLVGAGINPIAIVGMAAIVVEHGNIMPSGSPVGALMHGNSEWLTSGQVYLFASVGSLCALAAIAICLPLGLKMI